MFEFIVFMTVFGVHVGCNLIQNPGFEVNTVQGLQMWNESTGKIAFHTYFPHEGEIALESYKRLHKDDGPKQYVALKPGHRYDFQVYVKQFNDIHEVETQSFLSTVLYTMGQGRPETRSIARQPNVRSSEGWFLMRGSFMAPNSSFSAALISVHGPDPGVNFLVDDFRLDEIPEVQNMELESDNSIRDIRKSTVHFVFHKDTHMDVADIKVQIDLKHHNFGFGAYSTLMPVTHPYFVLYHHFFQAYFNWATVSHLGWPDKQTDYCFAGTYPNIRCMDGFQGDKSSNTSYVNINYANAVATLKELKKHGVKVRGESLFGRSQGPAVPDWVGHLDVKTLERLISSRASYMTDLTKGLINQWDVLNNPIEDQSYENITGDQDFSEKLLQMVQQVDPSVQLMMDQHDVVSGGADTQAYQRLASKLKPFGLSAIGAKCLINTEDFDPSLMKRRLDTLGTSGLPVWITELSVSDKDINIRADKLEKILTFFFSHPAVVGVTLAGVWDRFEGPPYTALFNGDTYKPNAAGLRYHDLIARKWSTHYTRSLKNGLTFDLSAFQGDYDVSIYYKGSIIKIAHLELGKVDIVYQTFITDKPAPSPAPTSSIARLHNQTPPKHSIVVIDTNGRHPIGVSKSNADNIQLSCTSRWSSTSASTNNAKVSVSCVGDEILTGCASAGVRNATGDWYNDGQSIVKEEATGRILCQAQNGPHDNGGVYAVARCCSGKDFRCGYYGAGPSRKFNGAIIQVECPQQYLALGCSGFQDNCDSKGAYPRSDVKACWTENGGTTHGAMTSAACCYSPGMVCTSVISKPSGLNKGDEATVVCDATRNYVMTSCQARSSVAKMAGAMIRIDSSGDECVAVNGASVTAWHEGTVAVATCCTVNPVHTLHGVSVPGVHGHNVPLQHVPGHGDPAHLDVTAQAGAVWNVTDGDGLVYSHSGATTPSPTKR